jgi:citrate lyase subunit beta / citryl-CoA lyase
MPMPLARSFLYVPANREKFLEKAIGLPSDAFIFDLEDSVPPAEKASARAGVREYAPKIAGERVWVRVNGLETGFAPDDLESVVGISGVAGFFLPKVETADEVRRWDAMITTLEGERARAAGDLKLVISIESALGVLNAYAMATASGRVVSLTFGGAQDGDLNTDLGCAWSIDGPEMLHARSHALLAARAARFDTPLDGVFADVRDAEGFERDTALSRRLGYRGRKLIHPAQINPCNRLYRPSAAELDYYARVLEAFDKAVAEGSAATTVDGRMVDLAMANAARRALAAEAAWKKAG